MSSEQRICEDCSGTGNIPFGELPLAKCDPCGGRGVIMSKLFPEHRLKIWPGYFSAVREGRKTFEIRKNDRNFQEGDALLLQEWDPDTKEYTGSEISTRISYVTDYGQPPGQVVFGLAPGKVIK